MKRRLIILAHSRKMKKRCIAGIDVETGEWVRPCWASGDGGLSGRWVDQYVQSLLDVVELPLENDGPNRDLQPENRRIIKGPWRTVGRATLQDILPVQRTAVLQYGPPCASLGNPLRPRFGGPGRFFEFDPAFWAGPLLYNGYPARQKGRSGVRFCRAAVSPARDRLLVREELPGIPDGDAKLPAGAESWAPLLARRVLLQARGRRHWACRRTTVTHRRCSLPQRECCQMQTAIRCNPIHTRDEK